MKEKIEHFLCYLESRGKHYELATSNYGDQYCTRCGAYLYTEYDQKLAIKDRKNWFKMWWQSED
jgi:hypothetical protein